MKLRKQETYWSMTCNTVDWENITNVNMSVTCSTVNREKHNECKYLSDDIASQEYLKKGRRELSDNNMCYAYNDYNQDALKRIEEVKVQIQKLFSGGGCVYVGGW